MNKVFFGKANTIDVITRCSYIHENKEWFNGIDVGDYIFIKVQGQESDDGALVNYLLRAKSWGTTSEGHELKFDKVVEFNNRLPLRKFIALDIFFLNKNLLNFAAGKPGAGCIAPLEVVENSEQVLEDEYKWNSYYDTNPFRNISILNDRDKADPNSRDVQIIVNGNTVNIYQSNFIPKEKFNPNILIQVAPGLKSSKRKMYDVLHSSTNTYSWKELSLVAFYDLFFTKVETKRKDFIEYCKTHGVPTACKQYESAIRTIEEKLFVNADNEYEKDRCSDLLTKVKSLPESETQDFPSKLKKFIEYKKSIDLDVNAPSNDGSGKKDIESPIKYQNKFSKVLLDSKNIIFRGAPGTGKSYLAKQIAADIISDGQPTDYNELDDKEKEQVAFVQFHPSYDYSDFVEGLRPIQKGDTIGFKLEDGTFKKFVDKARQDNQKNYVFIIDEINRGEISKILGELFFSIDPGYRGEKGGVFTQYSNLHDDPNEKFYIPENVFIIGTMNDIDRSVDTFDFAMRRRFRFIEIKANENIGMLEELPQEIKEKAIEKMTVLNGAIDQIDYLNSNYHIGAAYFLKLKDFNDMSIEEKFKVLWTDYLKPLLQEYINGTPTETDDMKKFKKAYFGIDIIDEEKADEAFNN